MRKYTQDIFALFVFIITIYLLSSVALSKLDFAYFGVDDSNIFFKYAKNIVDGYGIRWERAGERVEGFTSPLWLSVCVFVEFFFTNKIEALLIFNSSIFLLILFFLYKELINLNVNYYISILVCILFSTYPGVYNWLCFSLMETGIWCLLLFIFIKTLCRYLNTKGEKERNLLLLEIFLLLVTRPESTLILFVTFFSLFLLKKITLKPFLFYILTSVLIISLLTALRIYLFNQPLPNTFYAKVNFDFYYNILQGIRYVASLMLNNFVVFTILICYVILLIEEKTTYSREIALFLVLASELLSEVLTGGDHFMLYRKFAPFYLITILLFFNYRKRISNIFSKKIAITVSLILVASYIYTLTGKPFIAKHEYKITSIGRLEASFFNTTFKEKLPRVAAISVGGFAYEYNGDVIDIMGLNNTKMAHAKNLRRGLKNHAAFDIDTFYKLKPDFLVGVNDYCSNINKAYYEVILKGMLSTDKFNSLYKPYYFNSKVINCGYIRKDFLKEL